MEIFGQTDRNKGGAWPKAFVNILTHFLPLKNGKITPNMTNFISYILFLVCLSSFTFLFVTQAIASGSKLSWLSFSQEREQLIESDKTWSSFCLFSKSQHIFDPSLIETDLFSLLRLAWLAWEVAGKRIIWSDSTLALSFQHLIIWSDSSKHLVCFAEP